MLVVCFCGTEYVGEESIVCLNPGCSAYGKLQRVDGREPTVDEALNALEFALLATAAQYG